MKVWGCIANVQIFYQKGLKFDLKPLIMFLSILLIIMVNIGF